MFVQVYRWSLALFGPWQNIIAAGCHMIHATHGEEKTNMAAPLISLANLKAAVTQQFAFEKKHDSEEFDKHDSVCK